MPPNKAANFLLPKMKSLEAGYLPVQSTASRSSSGYFKWVLALATLVGLTWEWPFPFPGSQRHVVGSAERVLNDLKNLQKLALEHGSSRSVINGNLASVKYVVEEVEKLSGWKVWTEDVSVLL
jgi:hypothetical protein